MDEIKFEQIGAGSINRIGFDQTMTDIIFPFLEKISLLYFTGSVKPAQEHFITMLIRQKIIAELNSISLLNATSPHKFLIFMPEGEKQELSLLYLHYILKSKGYYVINIGQDISVNDAKVPYDMHLPRYIFTIFTEPHKQPVQQRVSILAETFPAATILLSGYQLLIKPLVEPPKNVCVLRNLSETVAFLEKLYTNT
jgi:MerR family transcriptional regulator, light-induced transcriptional regulator